MPGVTSQVMTELAAIVSNAATVVAESVARRAAYMTSRC